MPKSHPPALASQRSLAYTQMMLAFGSAEAMRKRRGFVSKKLLDNLAAAKLRYEDAKRQEAAGGHERAGTA